VIRDATERLASIRSGDRRTARRRNEATAAQRGAISTAVH
jgi:hypothetical protein